MLLFVIYSQFTIRISTIVSFLLLHLQFHKFEGFCNYLKTSKISALDVDCILPRECMGMCIKKTYESNFVFFPQTLII